MIARGPLLHVMHTFLHRCMCVHANASCISKWKHFGIWKWSHTHKGINTEIIAAAYIIFHTQERPTQLLLLICTLLMNEVNILYFPCRSLFFCPWALSSEVRLHYFVESCNVIGRCPCDAAPFCLLVWTHSTLLWFCCFFIFYCWYCHDLLTSKLAWSASNLSSNPLFKWSW